MKIKRILAFLAGMLIAISAVWITNQPEQVSHPTFAYITLSLCAVKPTKNSNVFPCHIVSESPKNDLLSAMFYISVRNSLTSLKRHKHP